MHFVEKGAGLYFPSMFINSREAGLSTAYISKRKFRMEESVHFRHQQLSVNNYK